MKTLREWRLDRLLSVRDLAKRSGVTAKTVVDLEYGRRTPHYETMRQLCAVLGWGRGRWRSSRRRWRSGGKTRPRRSLGRVGNARRPVGRPKDTRIVARGARLMATQRRRGKGEGSITRLADGRWQARVDLGYEGGKRVRKAFYGKTRREVQERLTRALGDHQRGLPLPHERQTVGQFLTDWLDNTARHTLRPTSYDGYADLVHHHLVPLLGRVPLAKLTPQQIAACYGDLLAKGLAPRTVQYAHAVLHRALDQAVRWNPVARNPTDAVDAPRPQRKEITVLTAEQAQRFLGAAEVDRLHALYVLALMTGMRQGELLGLRWQDVDLAAGSLSVRRTLVLHEPGLVVGRTEDGEGAPHHRAAGPGGRGAATAPRPPTRRTAPGGRTVGRPRPRLSEPHRQTP